MPTGEVVSCDRHEYVQLEVALRRCHADRDVVAHDLNGYHRDRFALGRVDFAGHDRRAGLVLGDVDLTETAARTGREPTHVVGNLHHVGSGSLDCAVREYKLIFDVSEWNLFARSRTACR